MVTTGSILPGRQGRRDPIDGFAPDEAAGPDVRLRHPGEDEGALAEGTCAWIEEVLGELDGTRRRRSPSPFWTTGGVRPRPHALTRPPGRQVTIPGTTVNCW
ncbi:hypothetical protein ABZ137_22825 [Streptomyces bobili]|uniref:hypothetical protein n=1 Tax=Streptomyces bobili TaxID=67280 RepID=UPI0033AE984E